MKKNNCYTFIGTSGSGNTTLVYEMGRELSARGKKVLLIDACSSGNLTDLFFDELVEKSENILENERCCVNGLPEILEIMRTKNLKSKDILDKIQEQIFEHDVMDIIPSNIMLVESIYNLSLLRNKEFYLGTLINILNQKIDYDYILIDSSSLSECYDMAYQSIVASFFGGVFITVKSNSLTHANGLIYTYHALRKVEQYFINKLPQHFLDFDSWFMGVIQSKDSLKTKDFLDEKFSDLKLLSVPVKNIYSQNNIPVLIDLLEKKSETIKKRWEKVEEIKRNAEPNKFLRDEIQNLNKIVQEKNQEINCLTQKIEEIHKKIKNAFTELEALKDKNSAIARMHARKVLNKLYKGEGSKCKIVDFLTNKFGFNPEYFYIEDEKTFEDMINPRLRCDLYFKVDDERYIIEIDGEQHFETTQYFNMSEKDFEILKEHDRIKNDYAKSHKIHMLRITDWEMRNKYQWQKDVENFLKNSIPGEVFYSKGYPKEFVFQ